MADDDEYNDCDQSMLGLSDIMEIAQLQQKRQERRMLTSRFNNDGNKLKNSTINNVDDSMISQNNYLERSNMMDQSFDMFAVSNNQYLNDSNPRRTRGPSQFFQRNIKNRESGNNSFVAIGGNERAGSTISSVEVES